MIEEEIRNVAPHTQVTFGRVTVDLSIPEVSKGNAVRRALADLSRIDWDTVTEEKTLVRNDNNFIYAVKFGRFQIDVYMTRSESGAESQAIVFLENEYDELKAGGFI